MRSRRRDEAHLEREKITMELSSAVQLATMLKNKEVFASKRVEVIISGGSVDLDALPWNS